MGLGDMGKVRNSKDRQRAKKDRDRRAAAARGKARKAAKKR